MQRQTEYIEGRKFWAILKPKFIHAQMCKPISDSEVQCLYFDVETYLLYRLGAADIVKFLGDDNPER